MPDLADLRDDLSDDRDCWCVVGLANVCWWLCDVAVMDDGE